MNKLQQDRRNAQRKNVHHSKPSFIVYFTNGEKETIEAENKFKIPTSGRKISIVLEKWDRRKYFYNWWKKRWQLTPFVSYPRQLFNWCKIQIQKMFGKSIEENTLY